MKDFKKMPKMACGGGVKKYAAGGGLEGSISEKDLENAALKSKARDIDPGIYSSARRGISEGINIPGIGKIKGSGDSGIYRTPSDTVDIPGVGRVPRTPAKTRGDAVLLKKGGKTKRGNKK